MTDPTPLSPAAQAVLDAANDAYWPWDAMCPADANVIAAAALRAAAEEVVLSKYQYADWQMADLIMKEMQSIVDELEGVNLL